MANDYEGDGGADLSENYRSSEENKFNHQVLVMNAMKKCLELGSVEMRSGYYEEKVNKSGGITFVWKEDTRKTFIESVKTLLMVTHCDYTGKEEKEFLDKIDKLKKDIISRKNFWMEQEYRWYMGLSNAQKNIANAEGKYVSRGCFNEKLEFKNFFYEEELDIYREICTIINDLTKHLNYYGNEGNVYF